ncbi:metal ABC transporter ATP-binding protein [Paenactinomyces guangxiensis]|uniref:Metal ABC transporter ATP-binding protein n=1 Tax=Paenactinomyces guangxiensis TaxID=1490290 RepID=A0A7W2A8H2_9BACL|nr:metal ABC transporter ATP-binding protein [Paenactinomyces guangxiensis]MBA4494162.1 metal ABC transporter ATP-binding protein [Paenactinomyces guangxiensis]MBH8591093.1 metal ABC transporter ATP-binding protein [Paenactinomyces guangxiensis]
MSKQIIQMKHVHFSYEHQKVLDDVNLTLMEGEFLGIIGPNGSGKSTLMKLILGLLRPRQGEIKVFGQPVRQIKDRSRIGYVSQKSNSFNRGFPATVREVVASGLVGKLGLFRRMKKTDWERIDQAIDQVGLTPLVKRNIGKLSGGQQQRAFIARSLVSDPDLLILDEPTVGIDAKSAEQFYEMLARLHRDRRLSLILVTHDIGVVSTYVDRVACLNKRLFFHGNPRDFVERQQEILSAAYGYEVQVMEHHH